MKKLSPLLALTAAALTLVVGCSKHDSTASTTDANGKKKADPRLLADRGRERVAPPPTPQSIKDSASQDGINLVFSDAQQKQENQIKALRSFVAPRRGRDRLFARGRNRLGACHARDQAGQYSRGS